MIQPETRYTTVGDDRVAYQILGEGPIDLLLTSGQFSHLDFVWEDPGVARFLRRLASFSRLIRFDARGTGLSDARPSGREVAHYWTEDLVAVLDKAGSRSVAILAWTDGALLSMQFAAAHPERVQALALFNPVARYMASPDYPQGHSPEFMDQFLDLVRKQWGTEQFAVANCPSLVNDERTRRLKATVFRSFGSPKAIAEGFSIRKKMDARNILPLIRARTLVMARRSHPWATLAQARYVAEHVTGAGFVELPGADGQPFWETPDLILDHVEEFMTGQRRGGEAERALLTILFTDIVDSTTLAVKLGDAQWHALLNRHDVISREQIDRFGGKLIERNGDGTLATFSGPGRAIDCAQALHEAMSTINLKLRAGLHSAEVELREDGRVGGLAVHIGARVLAHAGPSETTVSHAVQGNLMGSRHQFEDRGIHQLKGVPGKWILFAVVS